MRKGIMLIVLVAISLFHVSYAGEWKQCSADNIGDDVTVSSVTHTCCFISGEAQWTNPPSTDIFSCDRATVTTSHSPASVMLGSPVTFTATATGQFRIQSITILLDENNDGTSDRSLPSPAGTCTGTTCTYTTPGITYNTEGQTVNYKAFATPTRGGVSEMASIKSFVVSSNPYPAAPAITVTPDRQWYSSADSTVSLRFDYSDSSAADSGQQLSLCEYTITKAGTPSTTSEACSGSSATKTAAVTLSLCSQGVGGCSGSARAKDNRAAFGPTATRSIDVDTAVPSATTPAAGASCTATAGKVEKGENIVYTSTASDAASGVASGKCKLQIKKGTDAWASSTEYPMSGGCAGACSTALSVSAAISDPGIHNMRVLCTDIAGNAMNSNSNSGTVEVTDGVCTPSVLDVVVWDSKDPVNTLEDFWYTIVVSNTGGAAANGVTLAFILPAQINLRDSPPSGCSDSGSSRTCSMDIAGSGQWSRSMAVKSTEYSGTFSVIAIATDSAGSTASGRESTTVSGAVSPPATATTTTILGPPPSGLCPTEGAEQCNSGERYVCQRVDVADPRTPPSGSCATTDPAQCVGGSQYTCESGTSSLCAGSNSDYMRYTNDMAGCFPRTDDGRFFRINPGVSQSQASALCAAGAHLCTPEEYLAKPESRGTVPSDDTDIKFRLALGPIGEKYDAFKCNDGRTYFARSGTNKACLLAEYGTDNYMTSADPLCSGITEAHIGTLFFTSSSLFGFGGADFAGTCDDGNGNKGMGAMCCGTRAAVNTWTRGSSCPLPTELHWVHVGACAPDFSIAHDPNPLVLAPGEMGLTEVSIAPANDFMANVMLSGAWSGTVLGGGGITEDGKNFMYIPETINPAGGGIAVVYAGSTASLGDYILRTIGTSGSLTRIGDLTVRVAAPTDFAVVYPSPILIIKKRQKGDAVAITPVEIIPSSFAQPVTLSASWLDSAPAGVTFLFNPDVNPFSSGSPRQSDMIVTVPSVAPEGVYILRTVGTASAGERDTYLAVIIEPSGVEPFIIGPDTITINGIKYDYVERKFVDVLGQWQKTCTAPEGCPDFTRGMASDFFVTATVNSIPEADCTPDVGCSGTYTFGSKTLPLSWNPFRKAWKGTIDTLDAVALPVCVDTEFDLTANFVTASLAKEKTFKVHVNCDPKVVVSPYQARVPVGQKNAKIFDVMVYDPATISDASQYYDIELATDRFPAKREFLRHWVSMECAPGECGPLDMNLDDVKAAKLDNILDFRNLIELRKGEKGVISSDGLYRGKVPASDTARGLYTTSVRLNENGAQISGSYDYVFRASRNPTTEGKGTLSVYAEGLSEFSLLQGAVALLAGTFIAAASRRYRK